MRQSDPGQKETHPAKVLQETLTKGVNRIKQANKVCWSRQRWEAKVRRLYHRWPGGLRGGHWINSPVSPRVEGWGPPDKSWSWGVPPLLEMRLKAAREAAGMPWPLHPPVSHLPPVDSSGLNPLGAANMGPVTPFAEVTFPRPPAGRRQKRDLGAPNRKSIRMTSPTYLCPTEFCLRSKTETHLSIWK